jgi:hypothetical protein
MNEKQDGTWTKLPDAPDYCADKLVAPDSSGPAQHLADGRWCGHGEPLFHIFDVRNHNVTEYRIFLPEETKEDELLPPVVKLVSAEGAHSCLIYDPRRHPANLFAWNEYVNIEPRFAKPTSCQQCRGQSFHIAVGFEIPSDSESPNDTSWFAVAATCVGCGASGILFDDETA